MDGGVAMWLLPNFMEKPTAAASLACLPQNEKSSHFCVKEVVLTTFYLGVYHVVEIYRTDDINTETDRDIAP